jgi:hypothetical protein
MAIKIEAIEQDRKFKPFKITLDIENEAQADLMYAVFNSCNHLPSISYLLNMITDKQGSFDPKVYSEYIKWHSLRNA